MEQTIKPAIKFKPFSTIYFENIDEVALDHWILFLKSIINPNNRDNSDVKRNKRFTAMRMAKISPEIFLQTLMLFLIPL